MLRKITLVLIGISFSVAGFAKPTEIYSWNVTDSTEAKDTDPKFIYSDKTMYAGVRYQLENGLDDNGYHQVYESYDQRVPVLHFQWITENHGEIYFLSDDESKKVVCATVDPESFLIVFSRMGQPVPTGKCHITVKNLEKKQPSGLQYQIVHYLRFGVTVNQ
ncbi:MAG: hypothetical protein AB7F43_08015 [Bacteriovoracia bacterium]